MAKKEHDGHKGGHMGKGKSHPAGHKIKGFGHHLGKMHHGGKAGLEGPHEKGMHHK